MNTNPFADQLQIESAVPPSPNPYTPPCAPMRGVYDHRLFWRVVKCGAVLLLCALILDAAIVMRYSRAVYVHRGDSWTKTVVEFLTDWDAAKKVPDEWVSTSE